MQPAPESSVFSHPFLHDPRVIKLTKAQAEELHDYAAQLQQIQAQRARFVQYCVREHQSLEAGPFEFVADCLVPSDLLPTPVRL